MRAGSWAHRSFGEVHASIPERMRQLLAQEARHLSNGGLPRIACMDAHPFAHSMLGTAQRESFSIFNSNTVFVHEIRCGPSKFSPNFDIRKTFYIMV